MIKRILVGLGVFFLLALFVFGWERSVSYLAGTRRVLHAEADDRVPMQLERARIEALIEKEAEKILAFEDRTADLTGRREGMARTIQEAKRKLDAELQLLQRIKEMLDEDREEYLIGSQTYSFPEVNADALDRVAKVQQMQEALEFDESLLAELDTAIKQGRGNLSESRRRLGELRHALARLEQRNVNADIRLQVAQLVNSIASAPLSASSELENAMRNYERRVGVKENRAASRLMDNGSFRIDYSATIVTQDASAEIDRFLNATGSQRSPVSDGTPSRVSPGQVSQEAQQ